MRDGVRGWYGLIEGLSVGGAAVDVGEAWRVEVTTEPELWQAMVARCLFNGTLDPVG